MGYTAFGTELDDDGYPEWHRNRVLPSLDNPAPLPDSEYINAVNQIQDMRILIRRGLLSKHDLFEFEILRSRTNKFAKQYPQLIR